MNTAIEQKEYCMFSAAAIWLCLQVRWQHPNHSPEGASVRLGCDLLLAQSKESHIVSAPVNGTA